MDEELIRRYNERIGMNDNVLWLGDAFLCYFEKAKNIMDRLNGRKFIILGNHDRSVKSLSSLGFELIIDGASLNIAGRACRFSHYPYANVGHNKGEDDRYLEKRPERKKGEILIHGHTHKNQQVFENMIHVGVDAWSYFPVMYDELAQLIQKHFPVEHGNSHPNHVEEQRTRREVEG
jgi:calcineurin-like phosphoesterase family protein